MDKKNTIVGVFVVAAAVLFGLGLFLIGNQHKAFRKHVEFYTEFANLSGIAKGAKIRVAGMDGGQVTDIEIPNRPSSKFRLKLQVVENLHGLIRKDSVVTIETAGLVGDEFILIHEGTDPSPAAEPKSTLIGKEPLELGQLLQKASGLMNQVGGTLTQVDGTIKDVNGKLDDALQSVTKTVNNTNGIVTDIRAGRGTAGVLLEDPATAAQVKQTVANAQQATLNINAATQKVDSLITDLNARNLPAKTEETLNKVKSASAQADQAIQQINGTLTDALGEDQFGENAGTNLRQSLSSLNQATGNLADDTAALQQEFFFRGFFKKRGYNSLNDLPVDQYRDDKILQKPARHRTWIPASTLFQTAPDGSETLTAAGREQIDRVIAQEPNIYGSPLLIEGYAANGSPAQQLIASRSRAALVRSYLQIHFHLQPKNTGILPLSNRPQLPPRSRPTTASALCS